MKKLYWILIIVFCVLLTSSAASYSTFKITSDIKQKEISKISSELSSAENKINNLKSQLLFSKNSLHKANLQSDKSFFSCKS